MVFLFPIENGSQKLFLAFSIIFSVLPTIAVVMRILSRRIANRTLHFADYLMVASCVLLVMYQAVNISAVLVGGLGIHVKDIVERFGIASGQEMFIKHLIVMQVMWCLDLAMTKIAILLLYLHVFTLRKFIIVAKGTIVVIILWALTMMIGSALICRPIALYWDPKLPGSCGNFYGLWITTGTLNIVTDLIVLLLPMPYLYHLDLELYKKVVLMVMFGLGFLTVAVSGVRLWALLTFKQADSTGTTVPTALCSALEPAMGIIVGCVPLMRPLFRKRCNLTWTGRRSKRTTTTTGTTTTIQEGSQVHRFSRLQENGTPVMLRPDDVVHHTSSAGREKEGDEDVEAQLHEHHLRQQGEEHLRGHQYQKHQDSGSNEDEGSDRIELEPIRVRKTWDVEQKHRRVSYSDEEIILHRP
ncbi:hypothetical protein BX600DRAFT_553986 [Xylariales sp. PMI_506]|nr:hypothetical protein BX600DRAFT_553986 [Xylariales sp. PMI_506]